MSIIEIRNLTKSFKGNWRKPGNTAVDDLSFAVEKGEIFGFLGPNGAGKTTTLYTLLGFLKPTSGGGSVFGLPFGDPQALRRIGLLPEYVNLHEYYTPDGMLDYYARLSGLDPAKAKTRATYALERLGIADVRNKRISKFSKGMIQRLGLAQAVLGNPDLLFLDEPTSSLDPVGRKEVKDLLLELKAEGKTIVISSHILSDIESVCDRVVIIRKGKLMATGKLDELLASDDRVRITSEKLPAEAVTEIRNLGGVVTGSDTVFEIDLPNRDLEYDIIGVLRKYECPLVSVTQRKSSLEDYFFSIVKGDQPK